MLYIYDPISNTKIETSYELLHDITGIPYNTLTCYKSKHKKLKEINSYIIDETFDKDILYGFMIKESIKDEIWKTVDFNNKYLISNYGRIKRVYKNGKDRLLMPYIKKKNKRLVIKISKNGKQKEHFIDHLVSDMFLGHKEGMCRYHKDGNIYNNRVENIGFITRKELGRRTGSKSKSIPVLKIDIETGEVLEEYDSIRQAGKENYISYESIRLCIAGKSKTSGGFKWIIDKEFLKNKKVC